MHQDPVVGVIIAVTVLYIFSLTGRYIAQKFHQPSVLGELLMGVVLGNVGYLLGVQLVFIIREGSAIYTITHELLQGVALPQAIAQAVAQRDVPALMTALSGPGGLNLLKISYVVDILSRFGLIFLMFLVGLESSVDDLKKTGKESLIVACIGVLAPIVLGYLAVSLLMPEALLKTQIFLAATLSATSAGITARVFKDLRKLQTREASTILGAAMIDDILGLMILAIVSAIVVSGSVHLGKIIMILVDATLFFTVTLWLGPWLLKHTIRCLKFLDPWETKFAVAFLLMMILASFAALAQLATIIGAFIAGLLIKEEYFHDHKSLLTIHNLVAPIEALLAPLFFILVGLQVKLELFMRVDVISLAVALVIAAVIGKLLSGLGGHRQDDRWLIGIGMLPRGEVGLVFASIGKTLGVVTDDVFSAIILMVIVTTVITPIWLKSRYQKKMD